MNNISHVNKITTVSAVKNCVCLLSTQDLSHDVSCNELAKTEASAQETCYSSCAPEGSPPH